MCRVTDGSRCVTVAGCGAISTSGTGEEIGTLMAILQYLKMAFILVQHQNQHA